MHNEISLPGLIRNQNVCAGKKENILNMAAKYCICGTTLNKSGKLLP